MLLLPFIIQKLSGQPDPRVKLTLIWTLTFACWRSVQTRRLLRIWLRQLASCWSYRGSCRPANTSEVYQRCFCLTGPAGVLELNLISRVRNAHHVSHNLQVQSGICKKSGQNKPLRKQLKLWTTNNLRPTSSTRREKTCWAARKVAGWNLISIILLWAHLTYFGGQRCKLVNPQTWNLSEEECFDCSSCSSFSCQRLIFYRQSPSPVCVFRCASAVQGSTRTGGWEC